MARRRDISNQKFGLLTAIKCTGNKDKTGNYLWECMCECGNTAIVSVNKYCQLVHKNIKSCGICKKIVNGRSTSSCVFKLCELFKNPLHNHTLICKGKKKINVDIFLEKEQTVIEYDEWYWHKNKLDRDNLQTKYLLEYGYSVLRIKANDNMPSFNEVKNIINKIKSDNKYEELILDGWGI